MDDADLRTREDAMLARAAELCLSLAEHLHAEVLTAEPADKPALTKALHTALRSMRQSIALRRKVEREDRQASQAVASAAVALRKAQVRAGVAALAWNEHEPPEYEELLEALDEQLDADCLFDNFTAEPVEAHVDRLALAYGLGIESPAPSGDGRLSFDAAPDGQARIHDTG